MEANMMNTDDKRENAGCILAESSFPQDWKSWGKFICWLPF